MGTKISEIEYYLPESILDNLMLFNEFPDWPPDKIEQKLGIRERHIAAPGETSMDLAVKATRKILERIDSHQIDFILFCTQSPDYYLPSSACIIQELLGLKNSTGALDFNLGCSGYIYGLAIAKGLIYAGIAKKVLLLTAETYSKFIHPKDKANKTIFGDAGAATLIEYCDEEKILNFSLGTDGKGMNNLIVPNGGLRNPIQMNAPEEADTTGSIRTVNNLFMNGPEIFNFTIKTIPDLVNSVLSINSMILDDIQYIVFHQANKYMLEYLRQKLKVPVEKFFMDMINTGNTVSATIPIGLKISMSNEKVHPGDLVLLCGFGVGYSWGATIIKI
jgi:3-oxoacyl-[acyl-carrier-protein] synthase-3